MRIGRKAVISAIVALLTAGAAVAGAEMSAAVTHAPSAHVQMTAASGRSHTMYRN